MDTRLNPDAIRLMGGKTVKKLFGNASLCKIIEVETKTKTEGSTDYNGYVTVQRLHGGEVIRNVLLPMGMGGNSMFVGGLPIENDLCLLSSYSDRNIPIIIAYVPFRIDELLSKRSEVTDEKGETRDNFEQLFPGEYLVQSGKAVIDTAGVKRQVPLGRIKTDKDGRIIFRTQNQIVTITHGDALGDGTSLTNSKTNKNIVYRMECKKVDETVGITIDVDEDGAYIIENANGDYVKITDDSIEFDSKEIKLGSGAVQKMVLGQLFQGLFNTHIHTHPMGPTGPPINLMNNTYLSDKGKVE